MRSNPQIFTTKVLLATDGSAEAATIYHSGSGRTTPSTPERAEKAWRWVSR